MKAIYPFFVHRTVQKKWTDLFAFSRLLFSENPVVIECAMYVVELSYVSRHLFLTDLLSATFTLY